MIDRDLEQVFVSMFQYLGHYPLCSSRREAPAPVPTPVTTLVTAPVTTLVTAPVTTQVTALVRTPVT